MISAERTGLFELPTLLIIADPDARSTVKFMNMTRHYARILDSSILRDMQIVAKNMAL